MLVVLASATIRAAALPGMSSSPRYGQAVTELQRLDGGAMFGVVPKPLWERRAPADERNRIALAMRPLLVRGQKTMIIDAGAGSCH